MNDHKFGLAAGAALALLLLAACRGGGGPVAGPLHVLADSGASNPTVAADASTGTVYVAWVGTAAGESNVWLRSVGPEGEVGAPVRVNDLAGDAAPHLQAPAQVAVGSDGQVYVAWANNETVEGRRFPASNLRFARSLDGGRTFEPALTVNDDAGGPPTSHTFHNLVVAPDGRVIVSWLDSRREVQGSTDGVPGPDVRIAVSGDGGASFGASSIVDRQTCPCCRTALATDPAGRVYVAWRKIFTGDVRDVVVSASAGAAGSFGAPRRVADDGWVFPGCPHAGPALAVDADGTLHVTWYTGKAGAPGLFHTASDDGGQTFSPPTALLEDEWVPPSQTAMGVGADGTLWLAWEDRRLETPQLRLAAVGADALEGHGTKSDDEALASRAGVLDGTNPALVTTGDRAALAWLDGDRILYRTFEHR